MGHYYISARRQDARCCDLTSYNPVCRCFSKRQAQLPLGGKSWERAQTKSILNSRARQRRSKNILLLSQSACMHFSRPTDGGGRTTERRSLMREQRKVSNMHNNPAPRGNSCSYMQSGQKTQRIRCRGASHNAFHSQSIYIRTRPSSCEKGNWRNETTMHQQQNRFFVPCVRVCETEILPLQKRAGGSQHSCKLVIQDLLCQFIFWITFLFRHGGNNNFCWLCCPYQNMVAQEYYWQPHLCIVFSFKSQPRVLISAGFPTI